MFRTVERITVLSARKEVLQYVFCRNNPDTTVMHADNKFDKHLSATTSNWSAVLNVVCLSWW